MNPRLGFRPHPALLVTLLLAMPAFCWRESPVRYDTVVVYSTADRLRLSPDMGSPDPGTTWESYEAQYPLQAITNNAYCYSSTTRHERCFTLLRFRDSTTVRLEKDAFRSDSLTGATLGWGAFESAFAPPLRALLESRDYQVAEIELNKFNRMDRTEAAGWMVVLSWLPALAAASCVESLISHERREAFNWGRVFLMTGGITGAASAYAAISVDPAPNWKTTRIVFGAPGSR
jgi:hypothetical protein